MPKTLKRGDTYPAITGTVSDEQGPVPLGAAASVKLLLRNSPTPPEEAVLIECPLTVVAPEARRNDPDAGKWIYEWQVGDTDHLGEFRAEVEVIWDAGATPRIETFPNDDAANETVTFKQDLNPEDP